MLTAGLLYKLERDLIMTALALVLAVVVILLIRYKYKERDGGESAERDRELRAARQSKRDIISPTSQGNNIKFSRFTNFLPNYFKLKKLLFPKFPPNFR